MITRLNHIDPLSCGKILAVVHFGISLLFIPFFLLAMLMSAGAAHSNGGPNPAGIIAGMGIVFIIALPLIHTFVGFVGGLLGAVIYNLAAKMTGGLQLTFVELSSTPGSPYSPLPPR